MFLLNSNSRSTDCANKMLEALRWLIKCAAHFRNYASYAFNAIIKNSLIVKETTDVVAKPSGLLVECEITAVCWWTV